MTLRTILFACLFAIPYSALAAAPDLIITDIEVSYAVAEKYEIVVRVANQGDDPAQGFCVDLFAGLPAAPEVGDFAPDYHCDNIPLLPGTKRFYYFMMEPVANTWFDAIVDTDQLVAEADENNNVRSQFLP